MYYNRAAVKTVQRNNFVKTVKSYLYYNRSTAKIQ